MCRNTLIVMLLMFSFPGFAQLDKEHEKLLAEADNLFEQSLYLEAHPLYSQLVSLYPKNADFNFKFGTCALYSGGDKEAAIKHLSFATAKGAKVESYYFLGKAYHLNYQFKLAMDAYKDFNRKADDKLKANYDASRQIEMCEFGLGLLSSIKDLVVLDKKTASAEDFFRYYTLDNMGGKILVSPEELQTKVDKKKGFRSVIHFPGNSNTIYFSSYGKDENSGTDIYQATRLPDGSFTEIRKVFGYVNTDQDEAYPYLHPDGKTLYFASKGHNSMGGFDIFKSTFEPSTASFGPPVNLDFAVNTPDDDLFYIVDSLYQNAWFASGRSSAYGQLNVYNVMVQTIPLHLIFIQGDFISELNESSGKAKIVVTDELTDRPIIEVMSADYNGEYLLNLPKPGLYKFSVTPEGSFTTHEGLVEVPVFDESVALRQEIRLVRENGGEKLIIQNFFDEVLDVNMAALAADMLKRKASLDVNVSEELLAQLDGEKEPSLTIEKSMENAPLAAGFSEGATIESISAKATEDAASLREEANTITKRADLAFQLAKEKKITANQKLNAAEKLMLGVDEAKTSEYVQQLREYHLLVKEAEDLNFEARVAVETANRALDYADEITARAQGIEANREAMTGLNADENFDELVVAMRWEKDRLNQLNQGTEDNPETQANALADGKEQDEQRLIERISQLRGDQKELQNDVSRINRAVDNTTKKNEISKYQNELVEVEEGLTIIEEEIRLLTQKVDRVGSDEASFREQASFYALLIDEKANLGLKNAKPPKYTYDDINLLEAEIENSESRVAVLMIDDEETLALIGEETKFTRNSVELLPSLQAAAIEQNLEIKSVMRIDSDYRNKVLTISAADPATNSFKKRLLLKETIGSIDEQLALFEAARSTTTAASEKEDLDQEIKAMRGLQAQLNQELKAEPQVASKSFSNDEVRKAYLELMPDYNDRISAINNSGVSEIEQSLQTRDLKKELVLRAQKEQVNKESALNADMSAEELSKAMNSAALYNQVLATLNKDLTDVSNFKAAYETENKQIIESDEAIAKKLNEQISLSENYLATISSVIVAVEADEKQSTGDQLAALQKMLKDLYAEQNSAQLKLDTYRSDLELTLAAGTDPGATTASNRPRASTESTVDLAEGPDEIIAQILPSYSSEFQELERAELTPEELFAAQQALNESLIGTVEQEIKLRVELIDASIDEDDMEKYQLEIGRLEAIKTDKIDQNNAINERATLASVTAENLTTRRTDMSLKPEETQQFAETFARPATTDPKEAYASNLYEKLLSENENDEWVIDNEEEIYRYEQEIEQLEIEIALSDSESEMKKLDRQIEKKYQKLADEEVANARKLEHIVSAKFAANELKIEEVAIDKADVVAQSQWLQNEIQRLENKAASEMDEGRAMRQLAGPEIDEIKQNFLYREAFTYEQNALQYQQKILDIYTNAELLAAQDEATLDGLKSGIADETDPEILADAVEPKETLDAAKATSSTSDEVVNTEKNAESPDSNGGVPIEESVKSEPVANTIRTNTVIKEDSPEFISTQSVALATVVNRVQISDKMATDFEMEEEELVAFIQTPRVQSYLAMVDELADEESKRALIVQSHNTSIKELLSIELQIDQLEIDFANTSDEGEKATIRKEIEQLRAQAAVYYTKVEQQKEVINESTDQLESLASDVRTAYGNLNLTELADEVSTIVESSAAANKAAESNVASTEIDSNTAEPNSGSKPFPVAGADASARRSMPSTPEDFASFVFPSVLTEEIFVTTPYAAYSTGNPIPIDVALPAGIVYKVQVGAFRNPIPQDLYADFAPVSGERLDNGITRYTAGLFMQFGSADEAKNLIRTLGYRDAFVVAFRDGKRISLNDAKSATGEELYVTKSGPRASSTTNSISDNTQPAAEQNTTTDMATSTTKASTSTNSSESQPLKSDDYYTEVVGAAKANQVEVLEGLFYTVQIGVYSRPVPGRDLYNINPLNSELLAGGQIRYTTGIYNSLIDASVRKEEIRRLGIGDAFVTAYHNGKRIPIADASQIILTEGVDILDVRNAKDKAEVTNPKLEYDVVIGAFQNEVPAEAAKAMLLLEQRFGIFQLEKNGTTTYFSARVTSMQQAQDIKKEFEALGVTTTRIRGYRNGVEIPLN
jgi:epidermal growth factor receptor substrate 15